LVLFLTELEVVGSDFDASRSPAFVETEVLVLIFEEVEGLLP
jgi:hypothetical protein